MAGDVVQKLKLSAGMAGLVLNAPEGFVAGLGQAVDEQARDLYPFVLLFVSTETEWQTLCPVALRALNYDGLLWLAYPKQTSGQLTDMSRDVLWQLMEPLGQRPVTQIALDEVWTAMRFRPAGKVGS